MLVDKEICVGCHGCVVACPYGARFIPDSARGYYGKQTTPYEEAKAKTWQVGTAQKCDLCIDRLDVGLDPACIDACPTRSMTIGDLNDPHSAISLLIAQRPHFQPRAELGTEPNVFYLT